MSYQTYIVYGYGFCVDDIHTTPEKLLKLAATKPEVLREVRTYLAEKFYKGYEDKDLDMSDFCDLEGDFGEHGLSYVLLNVIDDFEVEYANDYDGTEFILFPPTFPWCFSERERNLSESDVKNMFMKYISVLTDEHVVIDYFNVENGS